MKELRLILFPAGGGILAGVFFGEYCTILAPFGAAYVMLLQAAVYPYVIASLLHGLGSLKPAQAFNLFRHGWVIYVLAWVLTFASLLVVALGIPPTDSPVATTPGSSGFDLMDVINLVIPKDIVGAIAQNYVPAVIVFCVAYGVAMQRLDDKSAMLSILDGVKRMSLQFWKWVIKLVPFAVFALVADTAGSTALANLEHLGSFLVLLFGVSVILAFWMLPAVMTALAPLRYREVLVDLRSAMLVSLATTLSVTALPYITEATRKVANQLDVPKEESEDVIGTNLSMIYVIGQLGNFFVLLFILFALYFFQTPEPLGNQVLLPFMTFLSNLGSPTATVNGVVFLSSWLQLPDAAPELYVELLVIIRYGMLMTTATGFGFLSILVTLAYFGKLRLRLGKLVMAVALPMAAIAALALGTRAVQETFVGNERRPYLNFTLAPGIIEGVDVTYRSLSDPGRPNAADNPSVLDRIQQTGELWVGYNDGIIPFSYRNRNDELVGYDIEAAYSLAHSLNVKLIFVPFEWEKLHDDLEAGRFDIAMAGIYVTNRRLFNLDVASPYFNSPIALFAPRKGIERFSSRSTINAIDGLRVGSFDDPVLIPLIKRLFPNAERVVVDSYAHLPDFDEIDAAIWSLDQATAMAAAHPGIQAIAPKDMGSNLLFAYLMPPHATEWRQYVDYWQEIRRRSGELADAQDYWLNGASRADRKPRWCILRDVLGWVN